MAQIGMGDRDSLPSPTPLATPALAATPPPPATMCSGGSSRTSGHSPASGSACSSPGSAGLSTLVDPAAVAAHAALGKARVPSPSPRSSQRSEERPRLLSVVVGSMPSLSSPSAADDGNPWIQPCSRGLLKALPGPLLSLSYPAAKLSPPASQRLPAAPPPPVSQHLCFPVPAPSAAMFGRAISLPAPRRPGFNSSVVMVSRYVEHQAFILRNHGVLVRATVKRHSASPLLLSKAIEGELRIPPHSLRVTRHLPEDFYIHFDFPADRDRAIALGRVILDGVTFLLQPWREAVHGTLQTYNLHVRVCIEKMPLHLWSIEGAESVFGKDPHICWEDTKIFSCWIWCLSLDHIPSEHHFTVFLGGAGRVVEMDGYSPPRREVAPSLEGLQFTALIHIDLVEDWCILETRTPSSRQSALHLDGARVGRGGPRHRRPPLVITCRDALTLPRRDDAGDDDDSRRRHRRPPPVLSCRDALTLPRRDDAGDDNDYRRRHGRELPATRLPASRASALR
ncbi:hypothetical protein BRADI_3g58111v3 [Brachypodium distachyon]|uniref:DUF4283 domain-containing protein n=1 Tax=Brachypodium distachyon TaxID=15368 RepID=A0A2K2D5M4_BRADI|nr:hypothetical protein BRADI_3g58111v3 [Brachypodium distachyon]